MALGEFEDTLAAQQQLIDAYAAQGDGGYVWDTSVDPTTGQTVQDAIAAPAAGSLADLARAGIDIAKVYVTSQGQKVRYTPVQTATGTQYQRTIASGVLDNPMLLGIMGIAAFMLLKGK